MGRRLSLIWLAQSILLPLARALCECGFTVNSTTSNDYALFTNVLETDFRHLATDAFDWDKRNKTGWAIQVFNQTAEQSRNGGHFGLNYTSSNVIVNPLKDKNAETGESKLDGDAGLQIWVRGQDANGMVSAGEITSIRNDIVYGSFRVGVKMTNVPGTCGAFFWYHNDSREIDIEYLSYQQNETSHPMNLVIQTPQSAAAGFNAAGTPDFKLMPMPFDPANDFHEFRFDWTPREVSYFADGKLIATMTYEIPSEPGQIFLNHWSNGNPGWSRGPPTEDALMTVRYVKAYFNTSAEAENTAFAKACTHKYQGADRSSHMCEVPDSQSFFYTQGGYPTPSNPPPTACFVCAPPTGTSTNSSGSNATVPAESGAEGLGMSTSERNGVVIACCLVTLSVLFVVL